MVGGNLLNISTVPVKIEINISNPQISNPNINKPEQGRPKMNVTMGEGGYKIEAQPAKINIDTYAARSSLGLGHMNDRDFIKMNAEEGIKLAYQGTARIVNEGNQLARGAKVSDIAAQHNRAGQSIQTIMEFLPKEGADVTFDKGVLNINYDVAELNIDWENLRTSTLEFTPGSVEVIVEQMPSVEIEYTGKPIYVPASSDPEHVPELDAKG